MIKGTTLRMTLTYINLNITLYVCNSSCKYHPNNQCSCFFGSIGWL